MATKGTTPTWQRLTIWIIALVMGAGTIISFGVMIAANQNPDANPTQIAANRQQELYNQQLEEYNKQMAEQQKELQKTYLPLDGFADKVGQFDAASITDLQVETLEQGEGATVEEGATIMADYTGWTPDGQIFDTTNSTDGGNASRTFSLAQVIDGWAQGLAGVRVGGVYELSIPAALAYGSTGTQDGSIAPDTPLKFIVRVVSISQ